MSEENSLESSSTTENAPSPETSKTLPPIPKMVWIIGSIMFCANVSSVIVYAFGGIYLKEVLGFKMSSVGFLEGLAEGTSFCMKLVSGILSDAIQKRKLLMVIGYGIVAFARYILAFFAAFSFPVVFARLTERIGNGIQAAPRSALVGDISPSKRIGACYGLKRSLATIGSFVGAIIALLIMHVSNNNYRFLFWFTTIPATIGFIVLIFFVKEPKKIKHAAVLSGIPSHAPKYKTTFRLANFKFLGTTFWKLMIVNAIFLLARMGETFLALHGRKTFDMPLALVPTIMMVFNIAWSSSSYPIGLIADKMNRYWLLCLGMICLILSDIVLASSTTLLTFYIGIALWGIQYGTTQNIFLSLINEIVPENLRGTGLGVYFIICATATMICDTAMGHVADQFGTRGAFVASGVISTFALMSLIVIMGYKIRQTSKK